MTIDYDDLDNRFKFHPADADRATRHEAAREASRRFAVSILQVMPEGRERSLFLTKVEEAMFWANAGIAREGV